LLNTAALILTLLAAPSARVNPALDAYAQGKSLFEAGEREQALVEFRRSYELSGNVEALFGVAQCEYHLGRLKDARQHYQQYIDSGKGTSEYVQIARLRVEAINRRGAVINIHTVPVEVNVTIEPVRGGRPPVTGQAPNSFQVDRGDYRVTASKDRYVSETLTLSIDSGETKALFFALEQKRGRLEVRTTPADATLYIRGNRARNPYIQEVDPGAYELYAEATDYAPRTETYAVNPGESRQIHFKLDYVQRSGRPELIGFWTAAGAVGGGMLVAARLSSGDSGTAAESTTVVAGGALVGGVAGALGATAFTPNYIRDNLALFRIGTAWIGAVEGSTLALAYRRNLTSAWVGGATGLTLGALTGVVLDDKAPNYGRVAIIQSGAAIGALAGALASPASIVMRNRASEGGGCVLTTPPPGSSAPPTCDQYGDPTIPPSWGVFGGLNIGLMAGLALAYLPDQSVYGPSWQHVMLVDLATAAGAIGGAIVDVLGRCIPVQGNCQFGTENPKERRRLARSALVGGALGLATGWVFTRNYDVGRSERPLERSTTLSFVTPTLFPVDSPAGTRTVPGVAAGGRF
jgi:hypothetical protein